MTYWDFNGHSTGYVMGLKQEIMGISWGAQGFSTIYATNNGVEQDLAKEYIVGLFGQSINGQMTYDIT